MQMIRYLRKRKCPKCLCDFVVFLLDRSSRIQSVNGFCGNCDHCINWQLIHKRTFAVRAKKARQEISYNRTCL
jgi:hypothetical protein